jgi:TetR/AcrR family transcriptional regulator, cholesterol catabolism regulator
MAVTRPPQPAMTHAERRDARYERRRQEIVDAAAEVFHRDGYSDGSIEEIAAAVGLLKGSLYYYIKSKEELLFLVLSRTYEQARVRIELVRAMEQLGPLDRLREYVREHIIFNATHTTKLATYYQDFELVGSDQAAVIREQRSQFEGYISELIVEAQAAGEIDASVDPKISAYLALGAMNSIYGWYRPNGRISPEELVDLGSSMIINGLAAPGPPPSHQGSRGRRT